MVLAAAFPLLDAGSCLDTVFDMSYELLRWELQGIRSRSLRSWPSRTQGTWTRKSTKSHIVGSRVICLVCEMPGHMLADMLSFSLCVDRS